MEKKRHWLGVQRGSFKDGKREIVLQAMIKKLISRVSLRLAWLFMKSTCLAISPKYLGVSRDLGDVPPPN